MTLSLNHNNVNIIGSIIIFRYFKDLTITSVLLACKEENDKNHFINR